MRNAMVFVGRRDGRAVVNWPGVLLGAALVSAIYLAGVLAVYFVTGGVSRCCRVSSAWWRSWRRSSP